MAPEKISLYANLVRKTCEQCGAEFYVSSRYAGMTRYCSNRCLQKAYRERRTHEQVEETEQLTTNQLIINDMDLTEKLFAAQESLNDLKIKYALLEKDFQGTAALQKQNEQLGKTLETKETEITELQSQLEQASDDYEAMKAAKGKLQKELGSALNDRSTLLLTNVMLQSAGPRMDGAKVSFEHILKFVPDFKFTKDQTFKMPVMRWILNHNAGDDACTVTTPKH
ncbi:hypothetical protein JW935_22405 [candidate division KSB1 bacterium]|nr:hypothetical protein [candidate division KSB1 bacterium]